MTTTEVTHLGTAPKPPKYDRRLMGVAIVMEIAAMALAYMAVYVPVLGPKLTRAEISHLWTPAIVAALVVALGSAWVVRTALRRRRADPSLREIRVGDDDPLPRIPQSLRIESVPAIWVWRAVAFSLGTVPFSVVLGAPLWLAWLAILTPWFPIIALEARAKAAANLLFACFGLMVILQLLHMVEHSTQIAQLGLTGGALADSHGVIGQLDFELVHFVADTTLWITLGALAIKFKARNAWLWVAFAAAALHQIEHFYLFYINLFDKTVYLSGGAAGIMGHYGLIGSPLDRPYLHYTYNFIVIVPMLIAFWDEGRYVDRMRSRSAAPVTPA
jgi:hypothetical protein